MSLHTQTWTGPKVPLGVGDRVRVKAWGLGARCQDVGRVGTVARLNISRVVVSFDDYEGGERAIDGDCLRSEAARRPTR